MCLSLCSLVGNNAGCVLGSLGAQKGMCCVDSTNQAGCAQDLPSASALLLHYFKDLQDHGFCPCSLLGNA